MKNAKQDYDLMSMGTIRNAIKQQNAKDDMINGQQPLYEEKLTWYGIDITDNPDAHKEIVPISDEAKKKIFENVRKDFEQTGRKPKDDVSIMESFYDLKDDYVKNIDGMDKLKSSWTMSQYRRAIHSEIESKVRELDKKWDWGQPVKKEVLNQVFGKKLDISI